MVFVKVVKNKAYFKKYQTKYRRRRENKTDYQQRRNLIKQQKNKYNSPKYRLVVRFTNTKCVCQIIYATIKGDMVVAQALSTELPRYGVKVGFTNYAAAYATGLLVGRRVLNKLKMDEEFKGQEEVDAEEYHMEDEHEGERRPFKVILDVGLARTTVGARIFGALKGVADAGCHVPHNIKRFPGYTPPEERGQEGKYDAEVHRDRIFGKHISEFMEQLEEEDKEKYEAQFSRYIKNDVDAEGMEDMYQKCHEAIRADPTPSEKKVREVKNKVEGNKITTPSGKVYYRCKKISKKERMSRVQQKKESAKKAFLKAQEEEDEE